MEVEDDTNGFLTNGLIRVTLPQQPMERYEQDGISGYVWRVVLRRAEYDIAPVLLHMTGFLFPVIQKETLVITHTFQKTSEVTLNCTMLETGYVRVFCKEQKGTSYRLYQECGGEPERDGCICVNVTAMENTPLSLTGSVSALHRSM